MRLSSLRSSVPASARPVASCGRVASAAIFLALTAGVLTPAMVASTTLQESAGPTPTAAASAQAAPAVQPPTPAPAAAPRETERTPPRVNAQPINIRLEIAITDQAGSSAPVTKTLNVIAADRADGSIRSKVGVPVRRWFSKSSPEAAMPAAFNIVELPLNIDVRPELIEGGRIKTNLILNYETISAAKDDAEPPRHSTVTANVRVVLENGKPLVVSQSADAATDRKVTVEMKATVLR